jgi:putative serine protease PepD
VESDSPADTAGLAQGDVITSFGSTAVANVQELTNAAYLTPPGTSVQVTYYADGAATAQTATITMGSFPADDPGPQVVSM